MLCKWFVISALCFLWRRVSYWYAKDELLACDGKAITMRFRKIFTKIEEQRSRLHRPTNCQTIVWDKATMTQNHAKV